VAAVDWGVFKPTYEARRRRPFLEELAAEREAGPEVAPGSLALLRRLEEAAPGDRKELLLGWVQGEVTRVLGFDSSESVERTQGFFKLGMDSLMSVQLRNRLQTGLGRSLPPTVALEYPTVEALTEYLARDVLSFTVPADTRAGVPRDDEGAAREPAPVELSEDELTALLARKLRQIG
jgi:myxalamid-type polyketide synthase MxaE and MxaD